jgi:selenoprotein W-related protein
VAEEVLSAVPQKVAALHIVPVTGGRFEVDVDGERVFDKKRVHRFPEPGEVARAVEERLGA